MSGSAHRQKDFSEPHHRLNVYKETYTPHRNFVFTYMNDYSQEGAGKINLHGNGMGVPSPDLVEKRAREIALIDERDPDEFTDADWSQAKRELLGETVTPPPEESEEAAKMEEEWEVTPDDRGHRVPRP